MPEAKVPATPAKKEKVKKEVTAKKEKVPATPGAPVTAPTQKEDAKHGISGAEIKEYVAPEPTGFPKSQTVYQADEAEKGDFIVEWVQNSEHVTFHPESNGKFSPANEQRVVPTLHTRVFSPKTRDDAKGDAEDFAKSKVGSKIFKK